MRTLLVTALVLSTFATALAADPAATPASHVRQIPVLRLGADGSVLAQVVSAEVSDAGAAPILIYAPQNRLPYPPSVSPAVAANAPAQFNISITPALNLSLNAEHQDALALARLPAPCAPLGVAPLQSTCGATLASATPHPALESTALIASLNLARPGALYSLTLGNTRLAATTNASYWTVPGYALDLARSPAPALVPGAARMTANENSLTVAGVWSLNSLGALSISGSLAESLIRSPLLPQGLSRDKAAVGISLSRGAFSGGVVGHVNSQSQPGTQSVGWAGLDVGLSWRTPWSGEFVFGARNLVTRGDEPLLPDPSAAKVLDDSRERTPYVEYRQDF